MKIKFLVIIFFLFGLTYSFSQSTGTNELVPFQTALKLNLNGFRIGLEQKVYKNTTLQIEVGTRGEKSILINPQLRIYKRILKKEFIYLGIGYLYKHQNNNYADSIYSVNSDNTHSPKYRKDFTVNKYIHAATLNTGIFFDEIWLKQTFRFEFNIGIGVRYKKSSRYGLLPNEEIFYSDSYILKHGIYEETNDKFKIYPELNLNLRLIIPIIK